MTYHFISGKHSTLKAWKELRSSLQANLDDYAHLKLVSNFWSSAPLSKRITDWDKPESWDDPWQLIYNGDFDESTIAIAMFYTLLLCEDQRWTKDRLVLLLIKDQSRALQRIILEIDGKWLLNLDHNIILDKSKMKIKPLIQQKYEFDGKQHRLTS